MSSYADLAALQRDLEHAAGAGHTIASIAREAGHQAATLGVMRTPGPALRALAPHSADGSTGVSLVKVATAMATAAAEAGARAVTGRL